MFLILNGYHHSAIWTSRPNSIRFLFVGLDEERSLQKKCGHTILIARPPFRCCCLPPLKKAQLNSDEQHAIFAHELQSEFILTAGFSTIYFVISVQQICLLKI